MGLTSLPGTSADWVAALRAGGETQRQAIERLRAHLLRGLESYLARRPELASRDPAERRALAEDLVQESLVTVLEKLDTFRGESHFLTWAAKIAVRQALTALRRRRWQEVSLDQLLAEDPLRPRELSGDTGGSDPEALAIRKGGCSKNGFLISGAVDNMDRVRGIHIPPRPRRRERRCVGLGSPSPLYIPWSRPT